MVLFGLKVGGQKNLQGNIATGFIIFWTTKHEKRSFEIFSSSQGLLPHAPPPQQTEVPINGLKTTSLNVQTGAPLALTGAPLAPDSDHLSLSRYLEFFQLYITDFCQISESFAISCNLK